MSDRSDIWHYDGESGVRHRAELRVTGDRFDLGEGTESHPVAALRPRERAGEYGLDGRPGWRIGGVDAELAALLPRFQRYGGGVIDRFGILPSAAAFAVLAAIALFGFLRTPALVARAVPTWVEARLGQVMVGDLGNNGCSSPEGRLALDVLTERLVAGPDARVHVVRYPMINAATLPGGQIILFDGLIQAARSPDEVAGVLGHELGHVHNRDVMESLLRQFGLTILLGGMEGRVATYTNALLGMSYSREAESSADRHAAEMLNAGAIRPAATADFFTRTAGAKAGKPKTGGADRWLGYLSSHPEPASRAKTFVAATRPTMNYTPSLDRQQWAALRSMCKATPAKVDRWNF